MKVGNPKFALNAVTLVAIWRGFVAMTGLLLNGLIGYTLYFLSAGKLAQFNYQYISPFFCRIVLGLIGCHIKYPKKSDYPAQQVLYIFNHNSYLDIFIIPAMRIPHCRYIISETTQNVLPLYISNLANGALFIPRQKEKERRIEFFKKTTEILKNTSWSIFTSPEGTHQFKHYIAPFNKGIFEMAMRSQTPLCPIFFKMDKEHNPFESYVFKAGGVTTFDFLPIVETKDWTQENLSEKISEVRKMFVEHFNEVHGENIS